MEFVKEFLLATDVFQSPIGPLKIEADDLGVCRISKGSFDNFAAIESENKFILQCIQELKEYFAGDRKIFEVNLSLQGTPFQKSVWKTLRKIPFGQTISYKTQAQSMGQEKAIRAIASANGRNPIPIIIPCHRVVGTSGDLTGFIWGLDSKAWLLQHESNCI